MNEILLLSGEKFVKKEKMGRFVKYYFENDIILNGNDIRNKQIQIKCNGLNEFFIRPFRTSFLNNKWYSNKFYSLTKNPFQGKKHTDKTKQKQSIVKKGKYVGEKNPFYGRTHTDETKNKIRNSLEGKFKGEKNPFYGRTHTDETKNKIRNSLEGKFKGEKNPFYGRTHTDETRKILQIKSYKWAKNNVDKMREKGISSLLKQSLGRKTTIEKMVENELINLNIEYKYNKILNNMYQYDFIIGKNILLEVQGDFWHANPLYYGENKKPLTERQIFKKERDFLKKEFAESKGYKIFYIWETEIKNKNFSVLNEIKRIMEK